MSKPIPEIPSGSLLGHLKSYVRNPLKFLQKQRKEYGDVFAFQVANRRLIFINQPDYIQRILQENQRNYKKSEAYRKLAMLLGDGLFTSEGAHWISQRRTIQPAFHRDQIKTYAQEMHDISMQLVNKWKNKRQIELTTEMTHVTLLIISKTMLGVDLDKEGETVEQNLPFALKYMVNRITSPLATPIWIPTKVNRKFKATIKVLDKMIYKIIEYKKDNLGIDLLSQLIMLRKEETGEPLSDKELRDEVMTLFLAGHETTAMGMTWILNYILRDQEVKAQLMQEIKYIKNPWDGVQNYYIQNVINEALRMFAPVWILSREATGDDRFGSYEIKKGDRLIFSPYIMHRHPDYWKNPDQFNPDRFGKGPSHKYAYFPFGGGPRVCIGQHFAIMEMTILLVNILKNFPEMHLKDPGPVGYDYSITLRPDREIDIELREG